MNKHTRHLRLVSSQSKPKAKRFLGLRSEENESSTGLGNGIVISLLFWLIIIGGSAAYVLLWK